MSYFGYDSLAVAAVVVLAAFAAANVGFTFWEHVQKARKPGKDVAAMLDNDNKRIAAQDERIEEVEKQQRLMLKAMMQLLQQASNPGSDHGQIQDTLEEIQTYLISR